MTSITLHEGDNRDTLRRLIADGVRVHSVVTDPPYFLESVVKRFGGAKAAPAKFGTDGAFARASRGFMGKTWDGADQDGSRIAQDPEFWALVYEVLLPGGYVAAFSSPRTGHWQACAMESAGFIMHPFIGWVYGSGMPKGHNLGKALDKMAGVEREVLGHRDAGSDMTGDNYGRNDGERRIAAVTAATSAEAQQWDGWFYGTQSMKPALEPIYLGQKPYETKTGFANVLLHGTGAVNIDACRVESDGLGRHRDGEDSQDRRYTDVGATNFARTPGPRGGDPLGRYPANLLHDGSDDVVAMFPDSKGQLAAASTSIETRKNQNTYGDMARGSGGMEPRNDSGSAARFFNSFPTSVNDATKGTDEEQQEVPEGDVIRYQAKATKTDRGASKHPTVKPIALMQWLCRLITPPGGTVLDPFAGSGTTGSAELAEGFNAILCEREPEYVADIRKRFIMDKPAEPHHADLAALLGDSSDDLALLLG